MNARETAKNITSIMRRYGVARSTYTIRRRPDRERLPFDMYTVEVMTTNHVTTAKMVRCLRSSGLAVQQMSAVSLHVAA